ncbi:MAG: diacylglycerol kinase [Pigmentiphaga sp.]|nr:diacylglycerol kinase [Pigmentiphaga sp.]
MTDPIPPVSRFKSVPGWRRLAAAFRYSWQGLRAAWRYEAAFRQELLLAVVLVPAAFWLARTPLEMIVLLLPVAAVLVVELLNSAIEAVADALSAEYHVLLGRAKDLGSAAVWLCLAVLFAVWLVVAVQRWLGAAPLS